MRIFVLQDEPIRLQLDFKQSELSNALFNTALNRLRNKDEMDVSKKGNEVSVEVIDGGAVETTGYAVNTVRQIFCGDIDPDADLSNCPKFIIGDWDEPEPMDELI